MAQAKAQKAVAAASAEGAFKQQVLELSPAAAGAVRNLLQVLLQQQFSLSESPATCAIENCSKTLLGCVLHT